MLVMTTSPTLNADGLDNAAIYIAGGNNNAALNAPIHYAVALDVRALNNVVDDDAALDHTGHKQCR